jgi:hypothetical protein
MTFGGGGEGPSHSSPKLRKLAWPARAMSQVVVDGDAELLGGAAQLLGYGWSGGTRSAYASQTTKERTLLKVRVGQSRLFW